MIIIKMPITKGVMPWNGEIGASGFFIAYEFVQESVINSEKRKIARIIIVM